MDPLRVIERLMALVMASTAYYSLRDIASLARTPDTSSLALLSAEAGGLLCLTVAFAVGNGGGYAPLLVHTCMLLPISTCMQVHLWVVQSLPASIIFGTYFASAYAATRSMLMLIGGVDQRRRHT
jgi:hypothetical protein